MRNYSTISIMCLRLSNENITSKTHPNEELNEFIGKVIKEETTNYYNILDCIFCQKFNTKEQGYTTLNVPYNSKTQLELADGSKVWVYS